MATNKQQAGFTLVELVIVIVILGILAATALPKFVDISTDAATAAKKASHASLKSAHSVFIAKKAASGATTIKPTVTELAAAISPAGTAAATGVTVKVNGADYTVLTFTDDACSTPTAAVGNLVACVDEYTPPSP